MDYCTYITFIADILNILYIYTVQVRWMYAKIKSLYTTATCQDFYLGILNLNDHSWGGGSISPRLFLQILGNKI